MFKTLFTLTVLLATSTVFAQDASKGQPLIDVLSKVGDQMGRSKPEPSNKEKLDQFCTHVQDEFNLASDKVDAEKNAKIVKEPTFYSVKDENKDCAIHSIHKIKHFNELLGKGVTPSCIGIMSASCQALQAKMNKNQVNSSMPATDNTAVNKHDGPANCVTCTSGGTANDAGSTTGGTTGGDNKPGR